MKALRRKEGENKAQWKKQKRGDQRVGQGENAATCGYQRGGQGPIQEDPGSPVQSIHTKSSRNEDI